MALTESKEVVNPHNDILRVVRDPQDDAWQQAASIEAEVFIDKDYVESQEELAQEYAKYLPATEFVEAERNGVVGGAIRIINYQPGIGFKTVDDIRSGKLDVTERGEELLRDTPLEDMLEVGTLAVKKGFRGMDSTRLAVVLYGVIYGLSRKHDCDYIIASFDEDYYGLFKALFDPSVEPLGPAKDYMGSPTVPALIHVFTLMQHAKENHEGMYNTMIEASQKI